MPMCAPCAACVWVQAWDLLDDVVEADNLGHFPATFAKAQVLATWLTRTQPCDECGEPLVQYLARCSWVFLGAGAGDDTDMQLTRVGPARLSHGTCLVAGAAVWATYTIVAVVVMSALALTRIRFARPLERNEN